MAADDADDVVCLQQDVDGVRYLVPSARVRLNSIVGHVTRGFPDDSESHPMTQGAVHDHRTALQHLHSQREGPDARDQCERHLFADDPGRLTDGQQFRLRCPTHGDVAKDAHRTRPCLPEREPWMGTPTDHLSPSPVLPQGNDSAGICDRELEQIRWVYRTRSKESGERQKHDCVSNRE